MEPDPELAQIKASGAVVHRTGAGGVELVVVHRPRYDDWSLPKGKLDPGEDWETAALREVQEETGQRGRLGRELDPVFYDDRKGRSKAVRYWLLEADPDGGAQFVPNEEVDEVLWLSPEAALDRLTYAKDRAVLEQAVPALRA